MLAQGLLSAPVLVKPEEGGHSKLAGILDMSDVVSCMVSKYDQMRAQPGALSVSPREVELASFLDGDTVSLMSLSTTEKTFKSIKAGASVQQVGFDYGLLCLSVEFTFGACPTRAHCGYAARWVRSNQFTSIRFDR